MCVFFIMRVRLACLYVCVLVCVSCVEGERKRNEGERTNGIPCYVVMTNTLPI